MACEEKSTIPRHWTPEEDELLRNAVEKYGAKQWKLIAQHVPSRTHTQCLQRWNKVLKPGLLKGPWNNEEDLLLKGLVQQSIATLKLQEAREDLFMDWKDSSKSGSKSSEDGEDEDSEEVSESKKWAKRIDWVLIAENIPGRTVKQCRDRWCSNLDPSIRKGSWSAEEDRVLLETQAKEGNCWAHIARLLPGRTEHAVKTRFRSILRARRREWSPEDDKILLEQHKIHGSQWATIAQCFEGRRTKNAVMTRFKQLQAQRKAMLRTGGPETRHPTRPQATLSTLSTASSSTTSSNNDNDSASNESKDIITITASGPFAGRMGHSSVGEAVEGYPSPMLHPSDSQAHTRQQLDEQQVDSPDELENNNSFVHDKQHSTKPLPQDMDHGSAFEQPNSIRDAINKLLENAKTENATPLNHHSTQSFAFGWKSVSPTAGPVQDVHDWSSACSDRKRPLTFKGYGDSWGGGMHGASEVSETVKDGILSLLELENDASVSNGASNVHPSSHDFEALPPPALAPSTAFAMPSPPPPAAATSATTNTTTTEFPFGVHGEPHHQHHHHQLYPQHSPQKKRRLLTYPSSSHSASSILTLASLSSSLGTNRRNTGDM